MLIPSVVLRKIELKLFATFLAVLVQGISGHAAQEFEIEVAADDEWFIINGEKFQAQTYCLGWESGESVVFLEGSEIGACASAKLLNIQRKEICEVWCE